jgi:hypothetical protein
MKAASGFTTRPELSSSPNVTLCKSACATLEEWLDLSLPRISTHNSLVDFEAEYAAWGRRCLEGLQAAESARSRAVAAVQCLIEEHDRGLLSKKLPRKITPTELPVSCRV